MRLWLPTDSASSIHRRPRCRCRHHTRQAQHSRDTNPGRTDIGASMFLLSPGPDLPERAVGKTAQSGIGRPGMAEIVLDGVTKVFADGYEAVKDMDLEVADGEFVILVGPSGCGKSTALRMIGGLEDTSAGELKIGDEVVNDRAPKERDIAMVFQNYALYPHMTVRDNMGFALKLAG